MGSRCAAWAGALCAGLLLSLPETSAFSSPLFVKSAIRKSNVNVASSLQTSVRCRPSVHRLSCQAEKASPGQTVTDGSTVAILGEAPGLPAYSGFAKVKIAGLDANLLVGPVFAVACFGFAFVLFPSILLSYAVSYFLDPNRRRWALSISPSSKFVLYKIIAGLPGMVHICT
jgi:hypothetical protein